MNLKMCFALLVTLPLLLFLGGCGGEEGYIPVTGIVKFSDGTIPSPPPELKMLGYIHFEPEGRVPNVTSGPRVASSEINPDDGSFALKTGEHDGAAATDYRVVLKVPKQYPPPPGMNKLPSVVPERYTAFETTPLKATVDSNNTTFDFVVEKE